MFKKTFSQCKVLTVLINLIFIALVTFVLLGGTSGIVGVVFGQDQEESIEDLEEKIAKYEDKIKKLDGQVQTLSRDIDAANSQISLTQLRIRVSLDNLRKKEIEIQGLAADIEDIARKILKLEDSIDHQEVVLNNRLRARYKAGDNSPLLIVFGADTLSNIIQTVEHLRVLGIQDKKLLTYMVETKKNYSEQKNLLEDKKQQQEKLKAQIQAEKNSLEAYRSRLQNQIEEKNRLLDITQNDEAKYQKLLADARKELNQIKNAAKVVSQQNGEKVNEGDIIGYQGNTGFSKGEHLHFGAYKYSSFSDIEGWDWYYSNYVDPAKKLKSKNIYWNDGCSKSGSRTVGNGDWSWPIASPTISQGFGRTCWSNIYYGGKDHPAYDMYGIAGTPVYAVNDGTAYFCKNCLGDGANGVFIFHDRGYMTLYWHLR